MIRSELSITEYHLPHLVDPSKFLMLGWRFHKTSQSPGQEKTDRMIRILYHFLSPRLVHLQTSSRQDPALSLTNHLTRINLKCLEEISYNPLDRKLTRRLRRKRMTGLVKLTKQMLNNLLSINDCSAKLLLLLRQTISPYLPSRRSPSINNNLGRSGTLMWQQSPLHCFLSSKRTKTWLIALLFNFLRDLKI